VHWKLCRFNAAGLETRVGLLTDHQSVIDLSAAGVLRMQPLLERADLAESLARLTEQHLTEYPLADVRLGTPVESQEVWAAGVTYLRSRQARMAESEFSANAYDRVYEAARPEIFFKSAPGKVVPSGESVGIRSDASWSVPEPELALVLNSSARLVGFTIGNDMSSRDIEGENLLYLPQAKIYSGSCAVGPCIVVGPAETEARGWTIHLKIHRDGNTVFAGETQVSQLKRSFGELIQCLFRCQQFPQGAVLLTGAGIVPPDAFTLRSGDHIQITIPAIGVLENAVRVV
jgi:2-dehydro-3-deoxy-D-arabinonate dehydratase